ncbi:MAG: DNA-binding response OmpR family regulator [Verrucomicrobiales bacterium]|jgi:DNA-binding response OmpR family regulator
MRVLFVEDSKHLRNYVAKALKRAGYATDVASDGEEGLFLATTNDYDAIVLDLMLPKIDGLEVLQRLRREGCKTHLIILTARTAIEDRVRGLELGADDYLIKPFAIEELVARVHALVRRGYDTKASVIEIGALKVDAAAKRATLDETELKIAPREYALLEYLAMRKGQIVSREEIENHVYDHAKEVKSNAVDSAVCLLRKHLHQDGRVFLKTMHRQGYLLDVH